MSFKRVRDSLKRHQNCLSVYTSSSAAASAKESPESHGYSDHNASFCGLSHDPKRHHHRSILTNNLSVSQWWHDRWRFRSSKATATERSGDGNCRYSEITSMKYRAFSISIMIHVGCCSSHNINHTWSLSISSKKMFIKQSIQATKATQKRTIRMRTRYANFYRQFTDLASVSTAIESLTDPRRTGQGKVLYSTSSTFGWTCASLTEKEGSTRSLSTSSLEQADLATRLIELITQPFSALPSSTTSAFSNPKMHMFIVSHVELFLFISGLVFQVIRRSLLLHQCPRRRSLDLLSGGGETRFLVAVWFQGPTRRACYEYR